MRRETGQAAVEYLALALALAIALVVPVGNGRPIASVLLDAIIGYLRAQAFVLSII